MNIRQRKRAMYFASALIVGLGAGLAGWGVVTPARLDGEPLAQADRPGRDAARPAGRAAAPAGDSSFDVPASKLARLASRNLRPPLFAPPPQKPAAREQPEPEPKAPMTVQLVGVFAEPGRSMAVFEKQGGDLAVCRVDEAIEDQGGEVLVKRITLNEVTVEYAGRTRTLVIDRTPRSLVFRPEARRRGR